MLCEKCHAPSSPGETVCSKCGAPLPQNIEGFEKTAEIQQRLKKLIDREGARIILSEDKFKALLIDFIPDYEKERKLLVNMCDAGILKNMITEGNRETAIMKARSSMQGEMFLSENAAEFVIACFTYLLGWPFEANLRIKEPEELEKEKKEEEKEKRVHLIEEKVFMPMDAVRFRLSSNVKIPEGYTKLESFCFDGYGFMKTVHLPSTLLAVGDYAFSNCKKLKGIEFPEDLRKIGAGAFSQCVNLTMVKLPEDIMEIADSTFSFCTALDTVEIPPRVESIGKEAFSGCENLDELYIPDSVKFIDTGAFSYCPDLTIHCYENSYVHKYCLTNGIPVEVASKGANLKTKKI